MMSAQELAERICETIHSLPEEQLDDVLRFVQDLKEIRGARISEEAVAPVYNIHTAAVRTGISDLAHQHDHYLYGVEKRDA
jgi:hypothetical protein